MRMNGWHKLHSARNDLFHAGRHALADGGDGGQGGSVVVRASSRPQSLAGILKTQKAASGGNGAGSKMHGRNAPDKVILVPLGTSVFEHIGNENATEAEHRARPGQRANQRGSEPPRSRSRSDAVTEEQPEVPDWIQRWRKPYSGTAGSDEEEGSDWSFDDDEVLALDAGAASSALDPSAPALRLVADMVREGEEVVLARGGAGGRGNSSMRALPSRPVPRTADPGSAGSRGTYTLELKLLADVGLLGLPNVGKSSLLRALTGASPRVAAFAFTTLRPQLGALQTRRGTSQLVLADIPGLIPGASVDRGLGHAFLRHVERTKALAFVVDLSRGRRGMLARPAGAGLGAAASGADSEELEKVGQDMLPAAQLRTLVAEVRAYAPELLERPALVVANKVDLLARPAASLAALEREAQAALGAQVVAVSALGGTGLEQLKLTLDALVQGEW